ncbi:SusC/RagA family TonB-linked outer membrane protein [Algoriphagus kandeliae]|uniref:SusC/RagA family TonB-linked outer membrane protein n=1 Tax=Algoriphagus kandeliae TaxID=2562278 RepID=A0A4Y9R189_9BACT|nr:TonB-dependent receptor [Algoriphagus kandeliae]TFV97692.1 SusC/RagA family TonB-linked outer membrane protein [Algoriphagus kandeliae]
MKKPLLRQLLMLSKRILYAFAIQLIFCSVLLANTGKAQMKSISEVKVSISLDDQPLRKAFSQLERKTDFKFTYNPNTIPLNQRISLDLENATVYQVLENLIRQTNLSFVQINKNIHVKLPSDSGKSISIQELEFIDIQGKVTDASGQPLPGVTVIVEGTTSGTVTDIDGSYSLSASEGDVLIFSFVGFESRRVTVGNQTTIDIQMAEDAQALEEVVVVGYGTQDRRKITGAISSIDSEDLGVVPVTSFDQSLQGRLPGVQVTQTTGSPGGAVTVRIRGFGSISASNEPLYVVDGFPIENESNQGNSGSGFSRLSINPLASFDPNDIESIDVLKDAAAAAIYGSRGANGVVIITTKKGKSGKPSIDFNHYTGWQVATNLPELMNSQEYLDMMVEARNNSWVDGDPDNRSNSDPDEIRPGNLRVGQFQTAPQHDTNWLDEIFRTAMMSNYNLSIKGGNQNIKYAISGGFFNQDGIIIGSGFKRYNFRANIDIKANEKLSMGFNFAPSISIHDRIRTEGNGNFVQGSVIHAAISARPSFPVYNEDGTYFNHRAGGTPPFLSNPVFLANELEEEVNVSRILTNYFAEYSFIEDLKLKVSLGADFNNITNLQFVPRSPNWPPFEAIVGQAYSFQSQAFSWLNENILTYSKKIGNHDFSILGGATFQKYRINRMDGSSQNIPTNSIKTVSAGTVINGLSQRIEEWSLVSYLARATYDYKGKYLISASARTDGSSRFGSETKYGFFPSGSIGWLFSDESFFPQSKFFSEGKLRLSYGLTGNNSIGNYSRFALLGNTRYVLGSDQQVVGGLSPSSIANDELGWEVSKSFNIGTDLYFFDNRIRLLADYYIKNTNDLLLNVPVPVTTGFTSALQNIGEVRNWGWEFALNTVNFDKEFKWSSDFNISFNNNRIIDLGGSGVDGVLLIEPPIFAIGQIYINQEGQPFSQFYGFKTDGIFQTEEEIANHNAEQPFARPGDYRFVDLNNDGIIDAQDRTVIGNPLPDFFYGLNNRFSYKNIELSIFLQGVSGGDIFNINGRSGATLGGTTNQLKDAVNRWKSPSEPGDGFHSRANVNDRNGNSRISDRWVEDGSFLRVKNITLSYTFKPALLNSIGLKTARIYLQGTNILTFTNYSGFDPEASFSNNNPLLQGLDWQVYPLNKTYTVGINASF